MEYLSVYTEYVTSGMYYIIILIDYKSTVCILRKSEFSDFISPIQSADVYSGIVILVSKK